MQDALGHTAPRDSVCTAPETATVPLGFAGSAAQLLVLLTANHGLHQTPATVLGCGVTRFRATPEPGVPVGTPHSSLLMAHEWVRVQHVNSCASCAHKCMRVGGVHTPA